MFGYEYHLILEKRKQKRRAKNKKKRKEKKRKQEKKRKNFHRISEAIIPSHPILSTQNDQHSISLTHQIPPHFIHPLIFGRTLHPATYSNRPIEPPTDRPTDPERQKPATLKRSFPPPPPFAIPLQRDTSKIKLKVLTTKRRRRDKVVHACMHRRDKVVHACMHARASHTS